MTGRGLLICLLFAACQREKPQPIENIPPTPVVSATVTGIPACDDYLRRVAACTKLTPAMRETLARGGGIWKQAADQKGAVATSATESCTAVSKLAEPSLTELGC